MAKEKSTSFSASNSARLSGLSSSWSRQDVVSAGVRWGAPSSGWSSPSTRINGWAGTLRCRSEPPRSTSWRSAAWTSNMIVGLGGRVGSVKWSGVPLDERPGVPGDELAADEQPGHATEREEGPEGDLRLARGLHALARGDDGAGEAAGDQRDEDGGDDGAAQEEAEHGGEL